MATSTWAWDQSRVSAPVSQSSSIFCQPSVIVWVSTSPFSSIFSPEQRTFSLRQLLLFLFSLQSCYQNCWLSSFIWMKIKRTWIKSFKGRKGTSFISDLGIAKCRPRHSARAAAVLVCPALPSLASIVVWGADCNKFNRYERERDWVITRHQSVTSDQWQVSLTPVCPLCCVQCFVFCEV